MAVRITSNASPTLEIRSASRFGRSEPRSGFEITAAPMSEIASYIGHIEVARKQIFFPVQRRISLKATELRMFIGRRRFLF
jgi:hypothetical protein